MIEFVDHLWKASEAPCLKLPALFFPWDLSPLLNLHWVLWLWSPEHPVCVSLPMPCLVTLSFWSTNVCLLSLLNYNLLDNRIIFFSNGISYCSGHIDGWINIHFVIQAPLPAFPCLSAPFKRLMPLWGWSSVAVPLVGFYSLWCVESDMSVGYQIQISSST